MSSSTGAATIAAGDDGDLSKTCAGGRKLLSATGTFTTPTVHPISVVYDNSTTASVFTKNVPVATKLVITIVCATAA